MAKLISPSTVAQIRAEKQKGIGLKPIARRFGVSPSTVSFYCRDLFTHPSRIYATEIEVRAAGGARKQKRPCSQCGTLVKKAAITGLCRPCLDGRPEMVNRAQVIVRQFTDIVKRETLQASPEHVHCTHLRGLPDPDKPIGYHGNYAWELPKGEEFCCSCMWTDAMVLEKV